MSESFAANFTLQISKELSAEALTQVRSSHTTIKLY